MAESGPPGGEHLIQPASFRPTPRPGYYVPAGAYVPTFLPRGTRVPAILFPSGHSRLAWREPAAQLVALNLVQRGFVVLGFDPVGQGERQMMPDLMKRGGNPWIGVVMMPNEPSPATRIACAMPVPGIGVHGARFQLAALAPQTCQTVAEGR